MESAAVAAASEQGLRRRRISSHQHECLLMQAVIAGADGREDAPRWNLLQWLQYWSTRLLPQPDGSTLTAERTKSVNSIDDEADSRDIRRRSSPLAL